MNKLSIVTPSLNQGKFIERTILSVLKQDLKPLEHIVIDGGSTDNTLEVLKKYSAQITWESQPDRGQSHALNRAFSKARGDIIGWLNSDDIYYPHTLKIVQDFFAAHPDIEVLYGDANFINTDDQVVEPYPTKPWNKNRLKHYCFISQPALFFRRELLERCGDLNESLHYCMDYEFWLRLSKNGVNFAYIPKILAGARIHPNAKTTQYHIQAHREVRKMVRNTLGYLPLRWKIALPIVILEKGIKKFFVRT